MSLPDDIKYSESHEWLRVDGDIAVMGITAFAVEQLSDLVFVDLPTGGHDVTAGAAFGEIESVKAVSDLNSLVTGEIVEVNDELADDLDLLKTDPYGAGWMIKVKMSDPSQVEGLLDAEAYGSLIAEA